MRNPNIDGDDTIVNRRQPRVLMINITRPTNQLNVDAMYEYCDNWRANGCPVWLVELLPFLMPMTLIGIAVTLIKLWQYFS